MVIKDQNKTKTLHASETVTQLHWIKLEKWAPKTNL